MNFFCINYEFARYKSVIMSTQSGAFCVGPVLEPLFELFLTADVRTFPLIKSDFI